MFVLENIKYEYFVFVILVSEILDMKKVVVLVGEKKL